MAKELDASKIAALLAKPKPTRGGRAPKDPTEPRTYDTWWKFYTKFGDCSNPNCPDDRPHRVVDGNTMVADIKDVKMCRICFLNGYLSTSELV